MKYEIKNFKKYEDGDVVFDVSIEGYNYSDVTVNPETLKVLSYCTLDSDEYEEEDENFAKYKDEIIEYVVNYYLKEKQL